MWNACKKTKRRKRNDIRSAFCCLRHNFLKIVKRTKKLEFGF